MRMHRKDKHCRTKWAEKFKLNSCPEAPCIHLRRHVKARTIYVVDFQPCHVLGCSELGGCEKAGVIDGEIFVVIFQNHQRCSLDTEERG